MKRVSFILFGLLLGTIVLRGAVIQVAPGTGTIQAAVNNASAGDVLMLTNGTYNEVAVKPLVAITLQAAEGTQPVVKLSSRMEAKADLTIDVVRLLAG